MEPVDHRGVPPQGVRIELLPGIASTGVATIEVVVAGNVGSCDTSANWGGFDSAADVSALRTGSVSNAFNTDTWYETSVPEGARVTQLIGQGEGRPIRITDSSGERFRGFQGDQVRGTVSV